MPAKTSNSSLKLASRRRMVPVPERGQASVWWAGWLYSLLLYEYLREQLRQLKQSLVLERNNSENGTALEQKNKKKPLSWLRTCLFVWHCSGLMWLRRLGYHPISSPGDAPRKSPNEIGCFWRNWGFLPFDVLNTYYMTFKLLNFQWYAHPAGLDFSFVFDLEKEMIPYAVSLVIIVFVKP